METAMPCKLKTFRYKETCGESNNRKSKHACIVEPHEATRRRLERTLPKDHEDHIFGKRFNSLSHHTLVRKFILMPQAVKILGAKAAVDEEWEKLEKVASLANDQSKEQKGGDPGSTKKSKEQSILLR